MPAAAAGKKIRAAVPVEHRTFIERFADSFRAGGFLFVHAGIRPGIPLEEQNGEDLRWIRAPFLDWPECHEALIVHGHTINPEIEELEGRIGIDTGAYCHGTLTALVVEGSARRFLQVVRNAPSGIDGDPVLACSSGAHGRPVVGA